MENQIQNKAPRLPVQDPQFWQRYSIAEKYFYLVLCHLLKKYADESGHVIGHDIAIKDSVPSFRSFGISQRICRSARKKLQDGGLITFRHVYGGEGHRVGTEYTLCEAAFRESPKEIHALILNKRSPELSTPADIPHGVRLILPHFELGLSEE